LDREAQAHEVAIGDDHMAGVMRGMADRDDSEAAAVEWMGRVGHLDLFRLGRWRLLEGGIKLLGRSTGSATRPC
jgi:hypothetical protein